MPNATIDPTRAQQGFDIWGAWSRQSDRYNAKDAQDVWRSINGTGGITAGTLYHEAKARGWRDDGAYQKVRPGKPKARPRDEQGAVPFDDELRF